LGTTLLALGSGCGNCDGGHGGGGGSNNASPGTHPTSVTGARKQILTGRLDLGLNDAGAPSGDQ
jgi:hypothetical protein